MKKQNWKRKRVVQQQHYKGKKCIRWADWVFKKIKYYYLREIKFFRNDRKQTQVDGHW